MQTMSADRLPALALLNFTTSAALDNWLNA
jgi:hypothetical protein